jgi:hypothetical protein
VIAAADLLGPAGRAHQEVGAVGADVRQAAQFAGGVAREEQRLVEVPGQHLARRERARRLDVAEVAEPLPGAGEDALAAQRVEAGIEVEGTRQGARPGDIGVDGEGEFHGRSSSGDREVWSESPNASWSGYAVRARAGEKARFLGGCPLYDPRRFRFTR